MDNEHKQLWIKKIFGFKWYLEFSNVLELIHDAKTSKCAKSYANANSILSVYSKSFWNVETVW